MRAERREKEGKRVGAINSHCEMLCMLLLKHILEVEDVNNRRNVLNIFLLNYALPLGASVSVQKPG